MASREPLGGKVEHWYGFAVSAHQPGAVTAVRCDVATSQTGWQLELDGKLPPALPEADRVRTWERLARDLFGEVNPARDEMVRHADASAGHFRLAILTDFRLRAALLIGPTPLVIARDWLAARLGTPLDPEERFRFLDGRPGGPMRPRGDIVCLCCHVGRNQIADAIAAGCRDLDAIGVATRAGTNCGRCRPEIGRLVETAGSR